MYKGNLSLNRGKTKDPVESPAEQETNGSGTRTGTIVNSNFVSFYNAPSTTAKVLDYIANGAKVEILDFDKGFYKIKYGLFNRIGYVSSNFCKEA